MIEKTVFVTNKGKTPLTDKCDGKEYTFPIGKTVEIPAVVATHIFGWEMDDKTSRVVRLGWSKTAKEVDQALARLAKFEIAAGHDGEAEEQVEKSYVVNANTVALSATIAGRKYTFNPRVTVEMTREDAMGVFGLGLKDKSTVFDRLSQQNPGIRVDEAFLAAIEISKESPAKAAAA